MKGKLMLPDGRDIEWSVTPGIGIIWWAGGTLSVRLPGRPDVPQIEAALIGWHAGEAAGRHTGRSMLQNEFRNLMDCRK